MQFYFTITVWRVILGGANFREKSKKAFRINFRDFKFRDSNSVQVCGVGANDDAIECTLELAEGFAL